MNRNLANKLISLSKTKSSGIFGGGAIYTGSAPLCDCQLDEVSGNYPRYNHKHEQPVYKERPCCETVEMQIHDIFHKI